MHSHLIGQEDREPGFVHQSQTQSEKNTERSVVGRSLPGGPLLSAQVRQSHKLQRIRKMWGSYESAHTDAGEKNLLRKEVSSTEVTRG